jgi:hypothetical protein
MVPFGSAIHESAYRYMNRCPVSATGYQAAIGTACPLGASPRVTELIRGRPSGRGTIRVKPEK